MEQLTLVPAGNSYHPAAGTSPPRWEIHVPDSTGRVRVEVEGGTQIELTIRAGRRDQLRVEAVRVGGKPARLILARTDARTLHVSNLLVEMDQGSRYPKVAVVELQKAQLHLAHRHVSELRLQDEAYVTASQCKIPILQLRGPCRARLITSGPAIGRIDYIGLPKLSRRGTEVPHLVLIPESDVTIREIRGLRCVVTRGAHLRISERANDLELQGPGELTVRRVAQDVRFSAPPPIIHMQAHAQMVHASGPIRLGEVRSASIVGTPASASPGAGHKQRASLGLVDAVSLDEGLRAVTLVDVNIPVTLHGLQMINALTEDAHLVIPLISAETPGRNLAGPRRRPAVDRAELLVQAWYARALSELAMTTGAPASVRTQLAWCAYRMRNATAPGRTERAVLIAYRLIGYGERVLPALLCYIALAVAMNVLDLMRNPVVVSSEGLAFWLRGLVDWLATPLHILKLTGERPGESGFSQPWDTVARLFVAVPFATGALAIRKYVKERFQRDS